MDIQEIGLEGVNWIYLTQDMDHWLAVMNNVMNIRAPYNARNILSILTTISFVSMTEFYVVG
jgi:hypothetical protein